MIDGLTGVAVSIAAQASGAQLDARTFARLATMNDADRAILKLLGPYALRSLPAFFAALERFGGYLFAGVLALSWKRRFDEVAEIGRAQKAERKFTAAREPEFSSVNGALRSDPSSSSSSAP